MFDGMVAFKFGGTTKIGELYNEVPDRISDTAILIGMGYAAGGTPVLGWVASFFAIFTAYVRTVGKSAGATYDFSGPMAKPQRMVVAIAAAFLLPVVAGAEPYNQVMTWALWLIVGGCVVTVIRRLKNISAELRGGGQARP
jgi:phosphatidylglycerophosphate synthase